MISNTGAFTDPIDNRVYKTVKIGSQVWMAENLNASRYRNGDPIPQIPDDEEWGEANNGAWCYYDNESKHERPFGKLYNWHTVKDPRSLAPEGWHIPTDEEWQELELYLGMGQHQLNITGWRGNTGGGKLKENGISHWHLPNEGATNESGFAAFPGGYRDVEGTFYVLGSSGYWWSSSEFERHFAWYRSLYYTSCKIHRTNSYEGDGFSIRCIKDSLPETEK
ncbi:MAG: hypothetical protein GY790_17795 [Bacteroidetes bacterium]|nr:hypothetical protein [Bacteroidota bacterium]